jgi:formate C-acetyltransferase
MKKKNQKMEEAAPRAKKLRNYILSYKPAVFAERGKIVTKSYQENGELPPILQRALALRDILEQTHVQIFPEELIVGNFCRTPLSAPVFPEYDVSMLMKEMDTIHSRRADPFEIAEEDKQILNEILPWWKGKTVKEQAWENFSPEMRHACGAFTMLLTALGSGVGHMVIDYGMVVRDGLKNSLHKIQELRDTLKPSQPEYKEKQVYYTAAEIVLQASIHFALRFANIAEQRIKTEKNPVRRKELAYIARICANVPAAPSKSFWEALQSFWFVHLILQLESNGHSVSPGRFDQYMYPFYLNENLEENDLASKEELLQCLWLKFNEINKVRDGVSSVAFGGYPMYQNLILGGQDSGGKDAVNDLSFLCIETSEKIGLPQPSLSIRWHLNTNRKFLPRAVWMSSYGMGMPAFFNDEVIVPILLEQGYSFSEARNYAIVGCVEPTVPGISEPWLTGGFINIAKFIELTIFNGFDPITRRQNEFQTGEVEKFKSFEDFCEAFYRQMAYYIRLHVEADNILDVLHGEICPTPFESVFIQDCMSEGKTTMSGGARFNSTSINAVGFANAVDSLVVVRKFIYDEKHFTWAEMKEILSRNYEGYEDVRLLFLNRAPKFGNNNAEVDSLAAKVLKRFSEEVHRYKNPRGGRYLCALYSIACHILLAEAIGATPDGRKAEMLLADGGVSCAQGRDRNSPTALLNSVTCLDHFIAPSGMLLNIKFNPSMLETPEMCDKISKMLEVFFRKKGTHIQLNVVDVATLKDAQRHPENYPTLVVRVAGFSVLFTSLDKITQEDIIARTEYGRG